MDKSTVAITVERYFDGRDFNGDHFISDIEAREGVEEIAYADPEVERAISLLLSRGFGVYTDDCWMRAPVAEYKATCFAAIKAQLEAAAREYVDTIIDKFKAEDADYIAFFEVRDEDPNRSDIEYILIKYGLYKQLKGDCRSANVLVFDDLVTDFSKPEVLADYKLVMATFAE